MTVLGGREALHAPGAIACQHHRYFVIKRELFFEHTGFALEVPECQQGLVAISDLRLTLAVVAKARDLENAGKQTNQHLRQ